MPNVFDNERRFIFTNWTTEDFTGMWEGNATLVKAGATIELPMYKAYIFCKHLVDREMNRDGRETQIGIDEARLVYEAKTIAEITGGTDSPALATLKEQIRAEVEAELTAKEAPIEEASSAPVSEEEFADLKEEVVTDTKPAPKKVAKK